MRLLQYRELDLRRVKPAFAKVCAAIEADDFKSADVNKSRFLRGATVDKAKIEQELRTEPTTLAPKETTPLRWLHATRSEVGSRCMTRSSAWIDRGTGTDEEFSTRPVSVVDALKKRLTGETNAVD